MGASVAHAPSSLLDWDWTDLDSPEPFAGALFAPTWGCPRLVVNRRVVQTDEDVIVLTSWASALLERGARYGLLDAEAIAPQPTA